MDVVAGLLPPLFMVVMILLVGLSAYRATQGAAKEDAEDDARRYPAQPHASPVGEGAEPGPRSGGPGSGAAGRPSSSRSGEGSS